MLRTAQQLEVIWEVLCPVVAEIIIDGPAEEKDEHNGCRNPERSIKIWVSLQYVEEIRARVNRRKTSAQNGGGVDVKELGVER